MFVTMFILYNSILHAQVRTFTYINYKKFYEIQTKRHTDLYSCFCASHVGDSQKDDKFVKLFIKTLQFRLTNNQRLRGKIAHLGNIIAITLNESVYGIRYKISRQLIISVSR